MTGCSDRDLHFSRIGPEAVVADLGGGRLTTDAGALLLREVAERTGLFGALDAAIPDPRHPAFITHDQRALIAQRVAAIALGYEDPNDHQHLCDDPALQLVAGTVPEADAALASPPTLRRLGNRIGRATLARVAEVLVDQFLAAHPEPPGHLVLDFDATDDPVHGRQEGRFFHGYYDHHCFLPLYVFCGDELLAAYLRPSDIDAAEHARAVLKLPVDKLRSAWPDARITVRGDSGFCRRRLMRWRDSRSIGYLLGPARNPAPRRAACDEIARAGRQSLRAGQPQRLFGSSSYAASSWGRARRVIVKAEHNARGPTRGSSSTCRATPGAYMRRCTAGAARWRTGSRSSS